jgi:glutamine synthetase
VAKALEKGYVFKVGMEPEFMLLRRGDDGSMSVADTLDTLERPCYDMKALSRQYDFITTVSKYQSQLGWDNYANDHEDANGQFETNFVFDDALITADRLIFLRYMVHMLAQQRGMQATFMPKPFSHLTGNGLHFHMSLWDAETDTNLFEDDGDPKGLGLSALAYTFLGGLLEHAKAYIGVTASTVNSYKRLIVGAPTSGATWAPAFVTYGRNNRTQMIRVPAPGRFEDRTIDGAANPYLAAAVVLASGLDGIERGLDPGEPNEVNMYEMPDAERESRGIGLLPTNLLDATRNLERDDALREALGRGRDEDYVDYFVRVKQREFKEFHDRVSEWEIDKYLSLF